MRVLRCVLAICLVIGMWTAGCSDDDGTGNGQPDGSVVADSSQADGVMEPDGGTPPGDSAPPDQSTLDAPTGSAALSAVIDKLILPTDVDEYAVDYDGTGKKNQFGAIALAMEQFGMGLQAELDLQMESGMILLLFEVFGDSIADADPVQVQANLGEDLDGDASNNFSGSEEFGISSMSPNDLILNGSIAGGKLTTIPGKLVMPIPFGSAGAIVVTLEKAQVSGDLSDTQQAIINGQINGAIPESDIDGKILPEVAVLITGMYQDPATDPMLKGVFEAMDTDQNGEISADEIKNDQIFGMFLAPDVDIDGDGTPDAMSAGMGFTAVSCIIKKSL